MTDLPPGFIPHDGGPCPVDLAYGHDFILNGTRKVSGAPRSVPFPPYSTADKVTAYRAHMSQDDAYARIAELEAALARTERNRDMWKGQCEQQAETIESQRNALAGMGAMTMWAGSKGDNA